MNVLAQLWIAIFLLAAQASAPPADIKTIDFKNFAYPWTKPNGGVPESWHWISGPANLHFRAVNGQHRFSSTASRNGERDRGPLIRVGRIVYGDLDGDGNDEAVIALNYSTGGTANWDYIYVYALRGGKPTLMARMETGSRGSGGLVGVSIENRQLILDFADKDRRVGDCCSEGYIRAHFKWLNGTFHQEGPLTRGNLDPKTGAPAPN